MPNARFPSLLSLFINLLLTVPNYTPGRGENDAPSYDSITEQRHGDNDGLARGVFGAHGLDPWPGVDRLLARRNPPFPLKPPANQFPPPPPQPPSKDATT